MKGDKSLDKTCGRLELYIKCSSKCADCECLTKKRGILRSGRESAPRSAKGKVEVLEKEEEDKEEV